MRVRELGGNISTLPLTSGVLRVPVKTKSMFLACILHTTKAKSSSSS